jgi:uncharacterized OB-fold protein
MAGNNKEAETQEVKGVFLYMRCPSCGAKLHIHARTCFKCGKRYNFNARTGKFIEPVIHGSKNQMTKYTAAQ